MIFIHFSSTLICKKPARIPVPFFWCMKETILCMCKNMCSEQNPLSACCLWLMVRELQPHQSNRLAFHLGLQTIWKKTLDNILHQTLFNVSEIILLFVIFRSVLWGSLWCFFLPEVAVMPTCHQSEWLWGASLINHLQLNLQQHCVFYMWEAGKKIYLWCYVKYFMGHIWPTAMNWHHNRGLGAIYWRVWECFATVTAA